MGIGNFIDGLLGIKDRPKRTITFVAPDSIEKRREKLQALNAYYESTGQKSVRWENGFGLTEKVSDEQQAVADYFNAKYNHK